jgi:hypothetical protein
MIGCSTGCVSSRSSRHVENDPAAAPSYAGGTPAGTKPLGFVVHASPRRCSSASGRTTPKRLAVRRVNRDRPSWKTRPPRALTISGLKKRGGGARSIRQDRRLPHTVRGTRHRDPLPGGRVRSYVTRVVHGDGEQASRNNLQAPANSPLSTAPSRNTSSAFSAHAG